jgi:hypothetical protein
MPRGGRRPGAGRKPKTRHELDRQALEYQARVLAHPSVPPTTNVTSPIEEFDAPDSLAIEERRVWLKQAPFAFSSRTLVPATALAFERYCQVVVLERKESESSARGGANHRGLLKQINAYELQFLLSPNGRPMPATVKTEAETAPSKLSRFRKAAAG